VIDPDELNPEKRQCYNSAIDIIADLLDTNPFDIHLSLIVGALACDALIKVVQKDKKQPTTVKVKKHSKKDIIH